MKCLLFVLLLSTSCLAQPGRKSPVASVTDCDKLRENNRYATREITALYALTDSLEDNVRSMMFGIEAKERELADCKAVANYLLQQNVRQSNIIRLTQRGRIPIAIGGLLIGLAGGLFLHNNIR